VELRKAGLMVDMITTMIMRGWGLGWIVCVFVF
jgi:hypothetical protein